MALAIPATESAHIPYISITDNKTVQPTFPIKEQGIIIEINNKIPYTDTVKSRYQTS